MTLQEELERERRRVAMYEEALEAMTRSRDLYKEAAEQALEALAAYRDVPAPAPDLPQQRPASRTPGALQQLTRTFERLKLKGQRQPAPEPAPEPSESAGPAAESGGTEAADGTDRSS
ncbi:hypothetical protein M878_03725 [Streptomyces roseochromogenus subsp. oscitans DS 12.976]|uniref:Uncharacterized protein n=1 Tax=Streptomyces roseochromogenus subsp. oscitans DS 12.976 TaxID=1352936 RepID=V6KV19_STRRC|nr:hypothetical protein M878_03725 [Streptomyces roseochromogenus subsp. oscitans DS 12.976]